MNMYYTSENYSANNILEVEEMEQCEGWAGPMASLQLWALVGS